jgi:hypothetical protein
MPDRSTREAQHPDTIGVEGARPYGIGGIVPDNAIASTYSVHSMSEGARLYVSDAPYVAPSYAERATCIGTRKNGQPCKAKADEGHTHCGSHLSQE